MVQTESTYYAMVAADTTLPRGIQRQRPSSRVCVDSCVGRCILAYCMPFVATPLGNHYHQLVFLVSPPCGWWLERAPCRNASFGIPPKIDVHSERCSLHSSNLRIQTAHRHRRLTYGMYRCSTTHTRSNLSVLTHSSSERRNASTWSLCSIAARNPGTLSAFAVEGSS